jgi:ribosome-binding protein aMBF1 (putative translation factor)
MARAKTAAQRAITVRPVDKATAMTTPPLSTLNQLIRHKREAKGYSLSELARKLGITIESLRDLEDYVDEIDEAPVWLARKLSFLLDIPPEQFFS